MSIITCIEDHNVIDKIIAHLKLTFMPERPPPQSLQQELLMTAEGMRNIFEILFSCFLLIQGLILALTYWFVGLG